MLGKIEGALAEMNANNATKADLAQMEARLLRWQIGMWIATMVALLGCCGADTGQVGGANSLAAHREKQRA